MSKKRKRTGRTARERAQLRARARMRAASTGRDSASGTAGGNVVWRQTAEEAARAAKPRYNGHACGHGAHGDAKYNRAKAKRAWRNQIGREGASRGSFPFSASATVQSDPFPKKAPGRGEWPGAARPSHGRFSSISNISRDRYRPLP